MKTTTAFIDAVLMISVLCSCQQRTDSWHIDDEKMQETKLVSIEDSLPPINAYSHIFINGDTLFIHDFRSLDNQFMLYDIAKERYLGSFGKTGNGPGEIINFANIMFDRYHNTMYGLEGNKWEIRGYKIDEALNNPDYMPFTKLKFDFDKVLRPINDSYFLNDSTVICNIYVLEENTASTQLGKVNLATGEMTILDNSPYIPKYRSALTVSPDNDKIVVTDKTHDRIRIFDIAGNIQKTIVGEDYEAAIDPATAFFESPVIVNDSVYVLYSGKGYDRSQGINRIVVVDLDGNYVRTLKTEVPLIGIAHHRPTNRLYFTTNSTPQFGYIPL